jgi:hypothetical protein
MGVISDVVAGVPVPALVHRRRPEALTHRSPRADHPPMSGWAWKMAGISSMVAFGWLWRNVGLVAAIVPPALTTLAAIVVQRSSR